jgi:aminoglycoside phosphotransferase family enzyme
VTGINNRAPDLGNFQGEAPAVQHDGAMTGGTDVSLAAKVAFLSRVKAYCGAARSVTVRETHMSWVFLTDGHAYKLKKSVRFPYLDFTSLARRKAACRAELHLNRRLAPGVYLDVVPLCQAEHDLAIGGPGGVIDWLVVMRRLDEAKTLEHVITRDGASRAQLDRLAVTLVAFYRRAPRVFVLPAAHLVHWRQSLAENRRGLLDARVHLAAGTVRGIDRILRRFLARRGRLLAHRVREGRIVDGHGDLRPEHIWLDDPIRIIDCLEFNARLRAVDPFDEIAYLSLECERLGRPEAGERIRRRVAMALRDGPSQHLFAFYRCHRAMLRARLAIAHLLEPDTRTPAKWPALARSYLALAAADARKLEQFLRIPRGR